MKYLMLSCLLVFTFPLLSQSNDCAGAEIICSSESVDFNPTGSGENDLDFGTAGCLEEGEHSSVWFYFEMEDGVPANSELSFIITPENGSDQDYDFALYGPNVNCTELGSPIRCSFAADSPSTGLQIGAGDDSENAFGDGYVNPITVNPGEGYYLLIDNFENDGVGFNLEWSGEASESLDCDATPPCAIFMNLDSDPQCQGEGALDYSFEMTETTDDFNVTWTSNSGHADWISNPSILNPSIDVPNGFAGDASFTITIDFTDFDCNRSTSMNIKVFEFPLIEGMDNEIIKCSNEPITLGPSNAISSSSLATWQLDGQFISNDILIESSDPGEYSLSVSLFGCTSYDTLIIAQEGVPIESVNLIDSTNICDGKNEGKIFIDSIVGGTAPYTFQSDPFGITDGNFIVGLESGIYQITVTDTEGCTKEETIEILDYETYEIALPADTIINLGEELSITAESDIPANQISLENWLIDGMFVGEGINYYSFFPTDNSTVEYHIIDENGCLYTESMQIRVLVNEAIYIANAFSPNDDDVNEIFFVQGGPSVSALKYMGIYNRWGELIFETEDVPVNDPSYGWNGQVKGKVLPNSGVFQYYAEIELFNGSIVQRKGSISVMR